MHNALPCHVGCTLQEEDWDADKPCIMAEEVVRGGQALLELRAHHITGADEEEGPEISDVILLSHKAWQTLVELFALRYPDAAQRMVAKAQGW